MKSRLLLLLLLAAPVAQAQSGFALLFAPFQCRTVGVPLAAPTGAFTLEAWVNYQGDPQVYGSYPFMAFGDDAPFFGIVGEHVRVIGKSGVIVEAEGIPPGAWRHVAYTFDGTTSRLYIGGTEVGTSTAAPPATGADLGIGCHIGDTVFPGYLDEVIVWNEARTAAQIAADRQGLSAEAIASPALLAYFKFDEGAGQVAVNAKPGGPDGTLGSLPEADLRDPVWTPVSRIITGVEDDAPGGAFALAQTGPNPFTESTTLALTVARTQSVRVAVYDALGREVVRLHDGLVAAGAAQPLTFDAAALPGGVYFVRAVGETSTASRRLTLLQ